MQDRRPEVLLVVEGETATTYIVESAWKACEGLGIDVRTRGLAELVSGDFGPNTIPMFVRSADPGLLPWIEALCKAGRPYFYYIDDCLWKLAGDSALARYYRHPLVQTTMREAMRGATAVVTNSPILAAELTGFTDHVLTLPPMHDFSVAQDISPDANGELRIGFAGSTSRIPDLALLSPALIHLMDAYPEIVFEFAGVLPPGLLPGPRVRFFPHTQDYRSYARFQAGRGWSIGLAPLRDSAANRCKTDNKYREYGACRIAGVYSGQPPYEGSVKPEETGLLVKNDPDHWFRAIAMLIEDPEKRVRIGNAAFDDVWSRYRAEVVAEAWAAEVRKVFPELPCAPVIPITSMWRRALFTLRHLGIQLTSVYSEGGIALVLGRVASRLKQLVVR